MIAVVINKKGGVGKSTFANQILPSYFYHSKNLKINLIEIDDENKDNKSLFATKIMNCRILPTKDIKKIDEIFYGDEDTIIDVGGNKTSTFFLNELKKINEFDSVVWFIPLGQGEQDNLNALETHNLIKELDKNAKINFVLSKTMTDDIEWEFVNFFGNAVLETKFAIKTQLEEVNYCVVKANSIISNSRYFGKTVYELAISDKDYRLKAKEEKDLNKKKDFIFMNRIKNEAIEYVEYLKKDLFLELDKLLKMSENE